MMSEKNDIEAFRAPGGSGWLMPLEFKELLFEPKRLFVVQDVPNQSIRGRHAHKETQQYLICLQGKIEVTLIDMEVKTTILFPYQGIYIDKMIWGWQEYFDNAKLLVLASTPYDRWDYIEDFSLWQQMRKSI